MIYLIAQVALFLLLAVVLGVLLGRWFWGRQGQEPVEFDETREMIEGKRRLDQCHNENVKLRRELKQSKDNLDRIDQHASMGDDGHLASQLEAANAQIQALMDDVQVRDDMISALEKNT